MLDSGIRQKVFRKNSRPGTKRNGVTGARGYIVLRSLRSCYLLTVFPAAVFSQKFRLKTHPKEQRLTLLVL